MLLCAYVVKKIRRVTILLRYQKFIVLRQPQAQCKM